MEGCEVENLAENCEEGGGVSERELEETCDEVGI